ncbi:MAG TPA: LacI family DNA-binding transcriptional regulator [Bacteroidales bacterium]|nr:LacI family DNA-binding transcriptional regulator [Bacteroidales bacterium]
MSSLKKYTLLDIARELNVSASTVSRALQDNPRISENMRRNVKDLAEKMEYQPDFRAMSLRKGSGRTLGVLLPQVDRHFFASVLRGVDEVSSEAGYNVLICQSYESVTKEAKLARSLLTGRIDGLLASISIETRNGEHFELLRRKNLPLVFFDRVLESLQVSKVVLDDHKGAMMAVEHLIETGRKKIVHFAGPGHIQIYANRTQGYLDALKKHDLPAEERLIFRGVITRQAGCEAFRVLREWPEMPDAVFSSGDYSALGAMICAKEAGLRVPHDLAFVGFANEPFGSIISPTLTSVDQHALEMGRLAATLLIQEIENKGKSFIPRKIVLDPLLIIRESTRSI